MRDLLNDVIDDLSGGHINKAEAKQRVERIVRACEKRRDYWVLPPAPDPWMRDTGGRPPTYPIGTWCEDTLCLSLPDEWKWAAAQL